MPNLRNEIRNIRKFTLENWDNKVMMHYFFTGLLVEKTEDGFTSIMVDVHNDAKEQWARAKIKGTYNQLTGNTLPV